MRPTMYWVTFLFIVLAGCKPQAAPTSGTKTLDGLAGTESRQNDCQGSYPSLSAWQADADTAIAGRARALIKYPATSLAAIDRVFTSIPAGLVRTVLLLGYEVNFVAYPAATCRSIKAGALSKAHGCAQTEQVTVAGGQGEKVVLVLSADPVDVAHSTLTGMMTLVSQRLGRIVAEGGTLTVGDTDDAAMATFRRELSIAVLQDAAMQGLTLAPLKGILPDNPTLTDAKTPLAQRRALWNEFLKTSPERAAAAETMIFANTGDSYYCSTDTRRRFAAWPLASKLWQDAMVPDFDALESLGKPDGAAAAATASQGFGLWGQWGEGNGPLRQLFANRVDDTGYAFPRLNGLRRGLDESDDWYSPPAWGQGRLGWRLRGDGNSATGFSDDW